MTPEEYREVQDAFDALCELPAPQRRAALEMRLSTPTLREAVASLLDMEGRRDGPFERPSFHEGIRRALTDALAESPDPPPPDSIGPYRIAARIGEGGMGVVFEAVQEHPPRSVALKMIRPGLASDSVLRRFQHESAILGLLQHPGIAQIYQAGMVETHLGPQPYFAMELVRGTPLPLYADRLELDLRRRLELFLRVCDAIQHAHTKGVIHRDLKPGNILVTDDAQPKVLDFGVARLTGTDMRATTPQTDWRQMVGTIPYSSPEQLAGDVSAVDTRSDVYSLGVVLYELLAHRLPYDLADKTLPEAARIIHQQDPAPLSCVDRVFRGDLETIAAKAMEKEQDRRYQTVADLAADIRRFMADEPIVARPASVMYQIRKFARRNRALVWGLAAGLFSLLSGLAGTVWGMRQAVLQGRIAERHAQRASTDAAKYEQIAHFTQELLAGIDPDVAQGRDTSLLEQVLRNSEGRIEAELTGHPEVEATVRRTVGITYRHLGKYDRAEPHLRRALALFEQALGIEDPATMGARDDLGVLYSKMGRYAEADVLLTTALEQRRRVLGEEHEDTLESWAALTELHLNRKEFDMAEPLAVRALELTQQVLGNDHPATTSRKNNLAVVYSNRNQLDLAQTLSLEVLESWRRLLGEDHPLTLTAMNNLGSVCGRLGELDEAEELLRGALEGRRRVLGNEHPSTLRTAQNLAAISKRQGRLDASADLYRQVMEGQEHVMGPDHPDVAATARGFAEVLHRLGRIDEATAVSENALRILRAALGEASPSTFNAMQDLAGLYLDQGRDSDAERMLREIVTWRRTAIGETDRQTCNAICGLARALQQQGRMEDAESELLAAYHRLESSQANESPGARQIVGRLASLYEAWGRPGDAAGWRARLPAPAESAPKPPGADGR